MPAVLTEATGERVFVIGDIHGCLEEPRAMLEYLEKEERFSNDDTLIFLGDYIDRGPNSKGVIDLLLAFRDRFPVTRFLKGNHEDMMLDFLGHGGTLGQAFLYNGGLETIQSYGISVFASREEMIEAIPSSHLNFYQELESIIVVDTFVCVHAGLNPVRALSAQDPNEIYWIRDDFIGQVHSFQKTVVFGHTPHKDILEHLPYKIGIDTGLVFGNKLTCIELRSGTLYHVGKGDTQVQLSQVDFAPMFDSV